MTQYAQYNPAVASPSPVVGWYDTEMLHYPNLPKAGLIEVTSAQWQQHFADPSGWVVNNGALQRTTSSTQI